MSGFFSNRSAWHWLLVAATAGVIGTAVVYASRQSFNIMAMMVLVLLAPFVLLVVPEIQKIGIAIILLDIPLQIDTYIGFDEAQADFSATIGYNLSVTTLALIMLYGHWALQLLTHWLEHRRTDGANPSLHKSHRLKKLSLLMPLVFIAFTASTYAVAQDPWRVTYELCVLIQNYLAMFYLLTHTRTRKDVIFIIAMLVIGMGLAGMVSTALWRTGQGFSFGLVNGRVDNDWQGLRVGGTVGAPNMTGGYFGCMLSVACGLLIAKVPRNYKWLCIAAMGFASIGLVVTLSRGAWLTFAVGIGIIMLLGVAFRIIKWTTVLAALVFLAGVIFVFRADIVERISGDDRGSAQSRIPLNNMAWNIIQDYPIMGVGLNNYDLVMQDYITPDLAGEWIYIVHNRYLLQWAETGLGGLVTFILVILVGLAGGWGAIKLRDPVLSPIALGAFAANCGLLFHMTVDIFAGRNVTSTFWITAGIQVLIWHMLLAEKHQQTTEQPTPQSSQPSPPQPAPLLPWARSA